MEDAKATSPQSPDDVADRGTHQEEPPGASTSGAEIWASYRMILYGDGLNHWDQTVVDHFERCNVETEQATLYKELKEIMANPGRRGFFSENLMDGQIVVVIPSPQEVKTKDDVSRWLQWWNQVLTDWPKGRIDTLVSPSTKYDAIVKMTAKVMGVNCVLVNVQKTTAAKQYKEHKQMLDKLWEHGIRRRTPETYEEDVRSVTKEPDEENEESGEERELIQTKEEEQRKDEDDESQRPRQDQKKKEAGRTYSTSEDPSEDDEGELSTPLTGHADLPKSLPSAITPWRKHGNKWLKCLAESAEKKMQDLEEERRRRSSGKSGKAKKKTNRDSSPEDTGRKDGRIELQELQPLPQGTRKVRGQGSVTAYYWVGNAWEISGDALLVLTDENLKIHNSRFKGALTSRAGKNYTEEISKKLKGWDAKAEDQKKVVVTTGGMLPYSIIIHMPHRVYTGPQDLGMYKREMITTLEKGIDQANELKCRRIVICTDGLRSSNLPWEHAENAALAVLNLHLGSNRGWNPIKEMIVTISPEQDAERKERAMGVKSGEITTPKTPKTTPDQTRPDQTKKGAQGSTNEDKPKQEEEEPKEPHSNATSPFVVPNETRYVATPPKGFSLKGTPSKTAGIPYEDTPPRGPNLRETPPRSTEQDHEERITAPGISSRNNPMRPRTEEQQQRQQEDEAADLDPYDIDQISDENEGDAENSDEETSIVTTTSKERAEYKKLRMAQRKGTKKEIVIYDIFRASERAARDIEWGTIETRDKRQAYVPEVGQYDYEIPATWANKLDEKVGLEVKATVKEWANVLMMPTYLSMTANKRLTSNFRTAYMAVAHDVLLRRMKKAAYEYSKQTMRQAQQDISEDEEDQPPQRRQQSTQPARSNEEEPTREPAGYDFKEYKKIRELIRPKKEREELKEYLKEVWPLLCTFTTNDEAKRIWLSHVTSDPIDKEEPVEKHFQRLVLENVNDEESYIARARAGMEQGRSLAQVWHKLKGVVVPGRYVKVLRLVTKGRPGELTFIKLPAEDTSVSQMDAAVKSWDLEHQYYEEKRKQGGRQPAPGDRREPPKQQPPPQYQRQPDRPTRTQAGPPQSRPTPAPRGGDYMPAEQYHKLTLEQKKALQVARQAAAGGPKK